MSKDKNKQESTTAEDIARLVLDKAMNKINKGVTIEDLAILMDTVQVAKDVLTTSNYELGTLDVPDPEEVKKRLQEAGGAITDGPDDVAEGVPLAVYHEEMKRLRQAYHDYKYEMAICGVHYRPFEEWYERETEDKKSSHGAYNKYVFDMGYARSVGATGAPTKSYEEWVLDREAKDRRIKSAYEAYDKYVFDMGSARMAGCTSPTKSYEEWVGS